MATAIDLHLGRRLRQQRKVMGLTLQQVATRLGMRFQQIQKYECGANRISAARLWSIAGVLKVPISYFYDGLEDPEQEEEREHLLSRRETIDLVQAYYQLDEKPRRQLLSLAQAMHAEHAQA